MNGQWAKDMLITKLYTFEIYRLLDRSASQLWQEYFALFPRSQSSDVQAHHLVIGYEILHDVAFWFSQDATVLGRDVDMCALDHRRHLYHI